MNIRPGIFLLVSLLPIAIIVARASIFHQSDTLQYWAYLGVSAIPFIYTYLKVKTGHRLNLLTGVGPWWIGIAVLHTGVIYWKLYNWYVNDDNYFLYRSLTLVFPIGMLLTGLPYVYNNIISKNFKEHLQSLPSTETGIGSNHELYKKLILSCLYNNLQEWNDKGRINPLEFSVFLRAIPGLVDDALKTDLTLYMDELKQEYAFDTAPNQSNAISPN